MRSNPMSDPLKLDKLICFSIDGHRFALPLLSVDRILQAVAVRNIPNAPPLLKGVMDYHGILVPLIDLRYRLKLPVRTIRASDYFLIVDTSKRKLALHIDEAGEALVPSEKDWTQTAALDPGMDATGILRTDEGIILIYDLETFLSSQEEELMYPHIKELTIDC